MRSAWPAKRFGRSFKKERPQLPSSFAVSTKNASENFMSTALSIREVFLLTKKMGDY